MEDKYARIRFDIVVNFIKPFLKKTSKILDIGCYTGDLLKILTQGSDYYGVDNDESALRIARERGAKTFLVDFEIQKLPFENQKFDIIIATEILEHLKDPEKLIVQIKNLLAEHGAVIISLPNECTLYHRLNMLLGRGIDGTGFAPHYHLHFPTLRQNSEFVGKYFKIIKKKYWVHLGRGKIEAILSVIPYKFWENITVFFPSLFARGVIFQLGEKCK